MHTWWLKYLLSFFKKEWKLSDYPVDLFQTSIPRLNDNNEVEAMPLRWMARIERSFLVGEGETREAALADLEISLRGYKEEYGTLPRPGAFMPIDPASIEQISLNEDLVKEFMQNIVGLAPGMYFLSDLSSLWDFEMLNEDMTPRDYQRKIALIYEVDVLDIKDGNLVKIFKRIREKRETNHE